jgi:hypothetical protein
VDGLKDAKAEILSPLFYTLQACRADGYIRGWQCFFLLSIFESELNLRVQGFLF